MIMMMLSVGQLFSRKKMEKKNDYFIFFHAQIMNAGVDDSSLFYSDIKIAVVNASDALLLLIFLKA